MKFYGHKYGRAYGAEGVISAMVTELLHNLAKQPRCIAEDMERGYSRGEAAAFAEECYPTECIRETLETVFGIEVKLTEIDDDCEAWYRLVDDCRGTYSVEFALQEVETEGRSPEYTLRKRPR